jgi:hypothetical protein
MGPGVRPGLETPAGRSPDRNRERQSLRDRFHPEPARYVILSRQAKDLHPLNGKRSIDGEHPSLRYPLIDS